MNILEKIIIHKRKEVDSRKEMIPARSYEGFPSYRIRRASFSEALANNYPSVIAEFKRKSPSRGVINAETCIYATITGYAKAGVDAISVLTDTVFFGGSLCDLQDASILTSQPLLRKDFIIDEYQIIEAKAFGASAILLIASILSVSQVKSMSFLARTLGMDVLLEINKEKELDKWIPDITLVGVNNRDLSSFEVNIENSLALLQKIPSECLKVAESGISDTETVRKLYREGFDAFLIGEAFMKTEKPYDTAASFINDIKNERKT